MRDPLANQREAINTGQIKALTFPGDQPCPLEVGQRFKLRSCHIEIYKVEKRRTLQGREWIVTWTRIEKDRVMLLRSTPFGGPRQTDENGDIIPATADEIERAHIDGAYTSSPAQAPAGEPEAVHPDEVIATPFHQQATTRDLAEKDRRHRDFRALPLADQVRAISESASAEVRSEMRQLERTAVKAAQKLGLAA